MDQWECSAGNLSTFPGPENMTCISEISSLLAKSYANVWTVRLKTLQAVWLSVFLAMPGPLPSITVNSALINSNIFNCYFSHETTSCFQWFTAATSLYFV